MLRSYSTVVQYPSKEGKSGHTEVCVAESAMQNQVGIDSGPLDEQLQLVFCNMYHYPSNQDASLSPPSLGRIGTFLKEFLTRSVAQVATTISKDEV